MKIAVHHRPGSFSDQWIEYFRKNDIDIKLVNCMDSDIIRQMDDCDGLMWHWSHGEYREVLFSRQLTYALERIGKRVFPDSRTCWHYDDKVGQKYLLEAIGAPLVPTHIFYDKAAAMKMVEDAEFPLVFKLRRGAGSSNVVLIRSVREARRLIAVAFGRGFSPLNRRNLFKDRIWHIRRDKDLRSLVGIGKGLVRLVVPTAFERHSSRDQGYIYLQDFIPGNNFDIRIVTIGNRAFGIKRLVRANDFRASGSGSILYSKEEIDLSCVETSFTISRRIGSQCMAFDYIFCGHKPCLTEISYAFSQEGYRNCPGFWDDGLAWREAKSPLEWYMAEDFAASLRQSSEPKQPR